MDLFLYDIGLPHERVKWWKMFLAATRKLVAKIPEYEQDIQLAGGKLHTKTILNFLIGKDVADFASTIFVFALLHLILIRFWYVKLLVNNGSIIRDYIKISIFTIYKEG